MYPALENQDIPAVKTALNKTPLVAVHRGLGEMGQSGIGEHLVDLQVGQGIGKACSGNHTGNRPHLHARLYKSYTFLNFIDKHHYPWAPLSGIVTNAFMTQP